MKKLCITTTFDSAVPRSQSPHNSRGVNTVKEYLHAANGGRL